MSGRTRFGEITEGDFSNLLQALSATTKGRSFLAEYRRRFEPDETRNVLEAIGRIEGQLATVRDQLQPERIAAELSRIAAILEVALDGAEPFAGDPAKRKALVERARSDLATLASGLGGLARLPQVARPEAVTNDLRFRDQAADAERVAPPDR